MLIIHFIPGQCRLTITTRNSGVGTHLGVHRFMDNNTGFVRWGDKGTGTLSPWPDVNLVGRGTCPFVPVESIWLERCFICLSSFCSCFSDS